MFEDGERLTPASGLAVSPALGLLLAQLLDGTRDRAALVRDWARATDRPPDPKTVDDVLHALDDALLLEGVRADAARDEQRRVYRSQGARAALCSGTSYPHDASMLAAEVAAWRAEAGVDPVAGPVTAVLAPHIEPRGGRACHGAAIAALAACPADIFIVLGTAHELLRHPFALTTLDFETPAGRVRTDADLVAALSTRGGGDLLADEVRHQTEHSVELQAVWIRLLHPEARIVPVLVGSIHDSILRGTTPDSDPARADFVQALRALKAEYGHRLCLVASVDFAHVGPNYGDDHAPDDAELAAVMDADRRLLDRVEAIDARGWFETLAADGNARNVCGAAPTWVLLAALEGTPVEAQRLRHDVWEIDPETGSHVSFATVAFRETEPTGRKDDG